MKKYEGVTVREYKSGHKVLKIAFSFRRVACRETLPDLDPDRPGDHKYASDLRAEIRSKIRRGEFNYADYFPESPKARQFGHAQSRLTVGQAQNIILADLKKAGREATTIASYAKSVRRMNERLGADTLVVDLTPEDFRQLLRDLPRSRKYWTNEFIPIRKALRRAEVDGIIVRSPLELVDIDELLPKHHAPPPDPFDRSEIEAILSTAAGYCPRAHNLIQAAFFTGARIEELVALTWDDVDFHAGTVRINKAAELSIKSATTKVVKTPSSDRLVDLLPKAREAFKRQQAITRFATRSRGGHIFVRWNSLDPFSNYDQLRLRWKTILDRAGVRYRPMKNTRHSYASHMLSTGELPIYVVSQLGHKSLTMLDRYARHVAGWKDEKVQKYGT